jgi:hypothetical protein
VTNIEEPLDIDQVWDKWEPDSYVRPIEPSGFVKTRYTGFISKLHDVKNQYGAIEATFDITVHGGTSDGRKVTFVRVNNRNRKRLDSSVTNGMIEVLKGGLGEKRPPKEIDNFKAVFNLHVANRTLFQFSFDWQGFCSECYADSLTKATGESDIVAAKAKATPKQKGEAGKFATKVKSWKGFPVVEGKLRHFVPCPTVTEHGNLLARGQVMAYFQVKGAAPAATSTASASGGAVVPF